MNSKNKLSPKLSAQGNRTEELKKKTTFSKRKEIPKKNGANPEPSLNGYALPQESRLNSRELLSVLSEMRNGNFSVRMPVDLLGLDGKICDTLNEIISMNDALMLELTKAGNIIGRQGNLTHRLVLPQIARGRWSDGIESINELISNLVSPTIEIAHVISSVAKGNLSEEMHLQIGSHKLQGEFLRIAREVNDMVKQLNLFSME